MYVALRDPFFHAPKCTADPSADHKKVMAAEQRMQPLSDLRSYYDSVSKKELLDNLSQLRASVYKQYPEKESFLQFISRNIKEKGTKLVSKFKGV